MIPFLIRRFLVAVARLVAVILVLGLIAEFSLSRLPGMEGAESRHLWNLAGSFDPDETADFLSRTAASARVILICWVTVIVFGISIGVSTPGCAEHPAFRFSRFRFWRPPGFPPSGWLVWLPSGRCTPGGTRDLRTANPLSEWKR